MIKRLLNLSKVGFVDLAVHGNDAWVCDKFYSALFHLDLTRLTLTLISILPSDNACGVGHFGPIEYYGGKLIIAPQSTDKILIFDLNNKDFIEISISDYVDTSFKQLFFGIVVYGNAAYFFPGRMHSILKLNLLTLEIKCINGWYKEIENEIAEEDRIIFFNLSNMGEGLVLLPCWQSGKALIFDMKTDKYQIIAFPDMNALSACVYTNSEWLLMERDYSSLSFYHNKAIKKIQISVPGYSSNQGFRQAYVYRGQIFLFPLCGNMILKVDLHTKKTECVMKLETDYNLADEVPYMGLNNMACCKMVSTNEVLYYSVFDGKIVKYNLQTNTYKEKKADLNKQDYIALGRNFYNCFFGQIVYETEDAGINHILDFFQIDKERKSGNMVESSVGEKIFSILR